MASIPFPLGDSRSLPLYLDIAVTLGDFCSSNATWPYSRNVQLKVGDFGNFGDAIDSWRSVMEFGRDDKRANHENIDHQERTTTFLIAQVWIDSY